MKKTSRPPRGFAAACLGAALPFAAALAPLLALAPAVATAQSARTVDAPLSTGSMSVPATWYLPAAPAKGFVVLMHGFMRNKGHMRDLATRLQRNDLVVLTPTIGAGQINDTRFLDGLAKAVSELRTLPTSDVEIPQRLMLAGHSAGGKNAVVLAAALRPALASRLVGVLLLDPVERDGALERALGSLAGTDVEILSLLAKPSSCNAQSNATALLTAHPASFKGMRFLAGTHCDAEGATSDFLCKVACGQPRAKTVTDTLDFAERWTTGFFEGSRDADFFPGGARYDALLRDLEGAPLD